MIKTLLILLLFPFIGYTQGQKVLLQNYSFLITDGEVKKLHQSNDTLYELKCYINRPCQPRPEAHYRILSSTKTEDFTILKLECLDTIALTTNHYPETRYSTLALKGVDSNHMGYLPLVLGLTKKQLDTIKTNIHSLKDKFFFTFYSDSYLKEISRLKKVTTKSEAMEIIEASKSDKYKSLAESYSNTETRDMYAAGFSAELLNRICIEKGYSPIGAGRAIDKLMK